MRKGSSSSASCSARSPVSLQSEKSEPAESDERRPASRFSSSSAAECSSRGREGEARVRRGIVGGSWLFEEEMVPVVGGLAGEQPKLQRRGVLSQSREERVLCDQGNLIGMDQVEPRGDFGSPLATRQIVGSRALDKLQTPFGLGKTEWLLDRLARDPDIEWVRKRTC